MGGVPVTIADIGGWGLAVVLMVFIVVAYTRGWIVPGSTARMFQAAWKDEAEARSRDAETTKEATLPLLHTAVTLLEDIQKRVTE